MPGTPAPDSIGGRVRSVLAKLFGGAIRDDGAPASPSPDARAAHLDTAPSRSAAPDPVEERLAETPGPDVRDESADIDLDDTVVTVPGDAPAPTAPTDAPDASWTVVRLRGRARELGVRGYSAMSKAQLLSAIAATEQ